jgi:hypothetical protein
MTTTCNRTPHRPIHKGLYRPAFEHDACGVGMICDINNRKGIEMAFVGKGDTGGDTIAFERRLYLMRKAARNLSHNHTGPCAFAPAAAMRRAAAAPGMCAPNDSSATPAGCGQ